MNKAIYFNNDTQSKCRCTGQLYYDFLDYAFSRADYFMLVYVNYYGKGYTKKQKYFKNALEKFKVRSRSNPSWPGTLKTFAHDTTYKVVFYRTEEAAKIILKEVAGLNEWTRGMPEDLAFFKGNQCWFYSVGHENIAAIIHANTDDIDFLVSIGLAKKENVFVPNDDYFAAYNEILE